MKVFLKLLFLIAMLFVGIVDVWAGSDPPTTQPYGITATTNVAPDAIAVIQSGLSLPFNLFSNWAQPLAVYRWPYEVFPAYRFQGPQNWRCCKASPTIAFNHSSPAIRPLNHFEAVSAIDRWA